MEERYHKAEVKADKEETPNNKPMARIYGVLVFILVVLFTYFSSYSDLIRDILVAVLAADYIYKFVSKR